MNSDKQPTITPMDCRYGAPMGRENWNSENIVDKSVRVFHVVLDSSGYDCGGAYWGFGERLYCSTDGVNYREFTRAKNRHEAIKSLSIAVHKLKRVNTGRRI